MLALPLGAQTRIDFNPAITQDEFEKFASTVAQGIYASPVQPAGAAGLLRVDVGLAVTGIHVDTKASYWLNSVNEDLTYVGDYLTVPRVILVKGLGAASVSVSYAKIPKTEISTYGGSIDIPIIRSGLLQPTLALRGTYATLRGAGSFDLTVYGAEAFLGKGFAFATIYGGYGLQRGNAEARIESTGIVLKGEPNTDRTTVGVRFSLGGPKLVLEVVESEARAYSAKLSFGL